jgi:hypothetical protein
MRVFRQMLRRQKYYEIVSGYTGEAVGRCTDQGLADCQREEPKDTFRRISKREFEKYDA